MKPSRSHAIARSLISDYVENGAHRDDGRLPSIRELQHIYNTSSTVITHALSILEAQGVVEKRHGQGCYVKDRGAATVAKSPNMLGLVIDSRGYEVMMHFLHGVQTFASEAGYHLMVGDSQLSYEAERAQVGRLVSAGCQAVIVLAAPRLKTDLSNDYLNSEFLDTPIVVADRALPEHKRTQVIFDNFHAGQEMTRLLIDMGYRRIAGMTLNTPDGRYLHRACGDRYAGYRHALASAGIAWRPEWEWLVDPTEHGHSVCNMEDCLDYLIRWRGMHNRPEALVALDDHYAIQTIHAAQELGISVPDSLYVTGADNLSQAWHFRPAFPTTAQDFRHAGELAARLALEEVQGERDGRVVYLLPAPIERRRAATTRHPSVGSPEADGPETVSPGPIREHSVLQGRG